MHHNASNVDSSHRKDYYEILEIERTANEDEIKRAYRKLAIRWHPDKNPDNPQLAEIKFKEVAEAYEVLRDPQKRAMYDRQGPNYNNTSSFRDYTNQRRYYQFRDPFEVYREFFAAGDPFEEFGLRSPFMRTGFGFGGSPFMGSFGGGFPGFGADTASSFGRSSGGTTRIFPRDATGVHKTTTTSWINGVKVKTTTTRSQNETEIITEHDGVVVERKVIQNELPPTEERRMPSVEDTESEEERQIQEALRLSLLEEEQRKKRLAEETDDDMQDDWELKEAIRLSLELEKQNQGEDLIDMTESSQKEDDNNSLPEVIDLTGDEDEDEELQAAKMLSLGGITNKE